MSPFIPHFTSECLNNIEQKDMSWPLVSKEELIEENINFVIQINGKKRSILKVKRDIDERNLLKEIQLNEKTKKLLENQKIQKTIFVSNRLINIIL
jgi:leucyl-tRNA synthetase